MRDLLSTSAAWYVCILSLVIGAVTCNGAPDSEPSEDPHNSTASTIRIHSHPLTGDEETAYTLRIDSPWPEGGQLHVNFPEHLEYGPVGYTITRYSDQRQPAWQVEQEGKLAHYDVESMPDRGVEGVTVQATARVVEPNQVRLGLTITNNSSEILHEVKPLLCFRYKDLSGFSQSTQDNFNYTYVVLNGRVTALANIETENPDTMVKAAPVQGVEPYRFGFSKKRGGYIDAPLDLGLSVITSEDDTRAVILYAPIGKSVLSNRFIPCLHADPYFGDIEPEQHFERIVNVIFADADWRNVVNEIMKQHARQSCDQSGKAKYDHRR
jgi:hypothetical protein